MGTIVVVGSNDLVVVRVDVTVLVANRVDVHLPFQVLAHDGFLSPRARRFSSTGLAKAAAEAVIKRAMESCMLSDWTS